MPQNVFDGNMVLLDVSQQGISQELNIEIAKIINFLYKRIEPSSTFASIVGVLDTKRSRVTTTDEYLDSLIRNLGFFIECIDEYLAALSTALRNNQSNAESFVARINEVQAKHKNSDSDFLKHKKAYSQTFSSSNVADSAKKRNELEYSYGFYNVFNSQCLDLISIIMSNPDIFGRLRKYKSEDVHKLCKTYLHACTGHICTHLSHLLSLRG